MKTMLRRIGCLVGFILIFVAAGLAERIGDQHYIIMVIGILLAAGCWQTKRT